MKLLIVAVLVCGFYYTSAQIFTTTGQRCFFPFIYQSRTYYSCITLFNDGTPWCSLTENYDRDRLYGNCTNVIPTYSGRNCHTPSWSYLGNTYTGCTTQFLGIPWCGTKAVVPAPFTVGAWGFCKVTIATPAPPPGPVPVACDARTFSGTAIQNSSCSFPFTYKGVTYNSCTGVESQGAWCSTSQNYAGGWGYCIYSRAIIPSSSGRNCIFPFKYRGVLYNHCVTYFNNFVPWCGTTADYDADKQWGNCRLPTCTR